MKVLFHVLGHKSLGHVRLIEPILLQLKDCELIIVSDNDILKYFREKNECKFVKLKCNNRSYKNKGGDLYEYHANLMDVVETEKPDYVVFGALFPAKDLKKIKCKKVLLSWAYREEEMEIFYEKKYYNLFDNVYITDFFLPKIVYKKNMRYIGPIMPEINEGVKKSLISKYKITENEFTVLVTVGGGGFKSADNILAKIGNIVREFKDVKFIIVSGPFYRKKFEMKNITVKKYEKHFLELMSLCDLVISEAGYNAVNEIILTRTPAILIPGHRGNDDQEKRAKLLNRYGIVVSESLDNISALIKSFVDKKRKVSTVQFINGKKIFCRNLLDRTYRKYDAYPIKIGKTCNNNCIYCEVLDIKNTYDKTLDEIKSELNVLLEKGYDEVILPCNSDVRKDFMTILKYTKILGFKITLRTNGRMFVYQDFTEEVQAFVDSFEVFINKEQNDVSSVKSFNQTIIGIKNILESNTNIQANIVITNEIYPILKNTFLIMKQIGVKSVWPVFPILKDKNENIPVIKDCYLQVDEAISYAKEIGLKVITEEIFHNPYISEYLNLNQNTAEVVYERKNDSEKKNISIVIPTYNRKKLLKNTLLSLFHQDFPSEEYEIIVVDDGGTDGTLEIIKNLDVNCNFKYVYWAREKPYVFGEPGNRAGPARNLGVDYSEGEYLLFWDSDMIAPTNLLRTYSQSFPNSNTIILGSRKMLRKGAVENLYVDATKSGTFQFSETNYSNLSWADRTLKSNNYNPYSYKWPWLLIISNNLLVQKDLFIKQNGFDSNFVFWGVEDQEFAYRLQSNKVQFLVNKDAFGYHQYHDNEYVAQKNISRIFTIHQNIFYAKHLKKQVYEAYEQFIATREKYTPPRMVTINLTNICDLNCLICFHNPATKSYNMDLSLKEIKSLLDSLKLLGVTTINFSGGEPTIRSDICDILSYAHNLNLKTVLNTNGQFSVHLLERIIEAKVDSVIFSVDSVTAKIHDKIRQKKGALKKCLLNIKHLLLLKSKLNLTTNVKIQCVVTSLNLTDIMNTVKYAKESGVDGILLQVFNPYRGLLEANRIRQYQMAHINMGLLWVKPEQYPILHATVDQLIKYKQRSGFISNSVNYLRLLYTYFENPSLSKLGIRCLSSNYFGIDNNGQVMPCWGLDWKIGNIRDSSLDAILQSAAFKNAREKMKKCDIPCLLTCYPDSIEKAMTLKRTV